jgi:hypothetical protein
MFFKEISQNKWKLAGRAPILTMQDPFYLANVQGWQIIGGVHTFEKHRHPGVLQYRTIFYRFKDDIAELISDNNNIIEPFAVGPNGMKDIRFIELNNGKIGVFTRPQGGSAGRGKIGYIEINSLEELEECLPKGRIIPNQFHEDEWGGANELQLLPDGRIGVLGHIAHFEGEVRHYYAMAFIFDPQTKKAGEIKIITTANEFPTVQPKKIDLGKIIFSGGLCRRQDGTADLYVGVGDVHAGKIQISDPFL